MMGWDPGRSLEKLWDFGKSLEKQLQILHNHWTVLVTSGEHGKKWNFHAVHEEEGGKSSGIFGEKGD